MYILWQFCFYFMPTIWQTDAYFISIKYELHREQHPSKIVSKIQKYHLTVEYVQALEDGVHGVRMAHFYVRVCIKLIKEPVMVICHCCHWVDVIFTVHNAAVSWGQTLQQKVVWYDRLNAFCSKNASIYEGSSRNWNSNTFLWYYCWIFCICNL